MIILRRNFAAAGIDVQQDTTDAKEEVCVDLSVGESYMQAGTSEAITVNKPYKLKRGGCIIVKTAERINVPNNVSGFLYSKGSLAARGLLVPNTKIDPRFSGNMDIAIYNAGKGVLMITKGMKFCSIIFQQNTHPINATSPRGGPTISTDRTSRLAAFVSANMGLLIITAAGVIVSVLGAAVATYITLKMQSH